jgi:hypothetical protein
LVKQLAKPPRRAFTHQRRQHLHLLQRQVQGQSLWAVPQLAVQQTLMHHQHQHLQHQGLRLVAQSQLAQSQLQQVLWLLHLAAAQSRL